MSNDRHATFNTATSAARVVAEQGRGVILSLTSGSAKGLAPMMGSSPGDAAIEAFLRYLAAETGPSGVRVVGIDAAGVAGTLTVARRVLTAALTTTGPSWSAAAL